MNDQRRVLFLCVHNAARSQIAEALLRHYASDRFEACSAGLQPTEVHPLTIEVLRERGIATDGLYAKPIGHYMGKATVHVAIAVCDPDEDDCPRLYPFALKNLNWTFEDPAVPRESPELQSEAFRRVRDQIEAKLQGWLRES